MYGYGKSAVARRAWSPANTESEMMDGTGHGCLFFPVLINTRRIVSTNLLHRLLFENISIGGRKRGAGQDVLEVRNAN